MYTTFFIPQRSLKILTLTVRNTVVLFVIITAAYFALPLLSVLVISSPAKAKTIFPAPASWTGSPSASAGSASIPVNHSSSPASTTAATSFGALLK